MSQPRGPVAVVAGAVDVVLDADDGARVSAEQRAWLTARGVRDPERLAATVAPAVRNA